ncbi:MAG: metal-dependent hydrolase [Promethearchaeota archaeon]
MFPFFHLAVPLLTAIIIEYFIKSNYLKKNTKPPKNAFYFNKLSLLLGSLLPDIIDKPVGLIFNSSGRFFAHSLLFLCILTIIVQLISKKRNLSLSLAFGIFTHLLLDIPTVPWFMPFVTYEFPWIANIDNWIWKYMHDPLVISTEICGIVILLSVLFSYRLFKKKNLKKFLFRIKY